MNTLKRICFTFVVICAMIYPPASGQCLSNTVASVIFLLRFSPKDLGIIHSALRLWEYDTIADVMIKRATEMNSQDYGFLHLIDNYLPPRAFLTVVSSLPVEQRAHLMELSLDGQHFDVDKIMEGIVYSLAREDQRYARNFLDLVRSLDCLFISSLQQISVELPVEIEPPTYPTEEPKTTSTPKNRLQYVLKHFNKRN